MSRPRVYYLPRRQVVLSLPASQIAAARSTAAARGLTLTVFVERSLTQHLDEILERSAPWAPAGGEHAGLQVRLPVVLLEELDGEAARLGVGRTRIVESALSYTLGLVDGDDDPYDWG